MLQFGIKNPVARLEDLGISNYLQAYWNESPEFLVEAAIRNQQAVLSDQGALVVQTGKFTGRSPLDRFIVKDKITQDTVDWNKINLPFTTAGFDQLYQKITAYFVDREVYVRDAFAGADPAYRLQVRVVNEYPWSNQFAYNMFLRPSATELRNFTPEWTVINAPGFLADPEVDGTRQTNFAIINFTRRCVIVGGTGYTGEIKKGIFSVLNFILPHQR
ncbi:MAG: phosphoenolpyruvate carboxykinase (ATP), partial [Bacteroidetes bacterium]